jgi:truncated hemoglobin YjbI
MHSALTSLTPQEREQVAAALSRALDEIAEVVRVHVPGQVGPRAEA